ncbi:MAG: hypothetical protein M1830_008485 [Pleopsidium flavum]|nr:MAG: hypothetical protein M1830_008485 [Pleopsidium flavum]
MRPTLVKAIVGIFFYAHAGFAFQRECSDQYGKPPLADCMAALQRIPLSFNPIFFSPEPGVQGAIKCPFVISSGTCEVKVQCSYRIRTKWLVVRNLGELLITGLPVRDKTVSYGCVKDLGLGGVATAGQVNDPMWVEVRDAGVAGPHEDGKSAPLLKGVGPPLRFTPGGAPLPPGWFPPQSEPGSSSNNPGSSSNNPGAEADIENVKTS